tara:strand:- start:2676 stop:3452 length:777 start_codon:yes stop_codon:yes gene_type:complete
MSSSNINKKITLITLSLNSARTIADTLASVSCQDYSNIEHIIIDGCSSDSTQSIIEEYAKKSNHEVRIFNHAPKGIYNALNFGIELSTGEVIGIIHSDDYFKTEHSVTDIMKNFKESTLCVFGNIDIINNNKIVRRWIDKYKTESRGFWWAPPHTASYMNKNLYIKYGTYDESYHISGDYEFFCRLPRNVVKDFQHFNDAIVIQRIGGISTSFKTSFKKNFEDFKILRKYSGKPIRDFVSKKISKINQLSYSFLNSEK